MMCFLEEGRNENQDVLLSFSSHKKTISPHTKPSGLESVSLTTIITSDVCLSVPKFKTLGTLQI